MYKLASRNEPARGVSFRMYLPPAFAEHDPRVLHEFIDAHPLGILVTAAGGAAPVATHLPMVLDRDRGVLQGHLARANPQATSAAGEALVIFTGPDAYVHPGWYPSKAEHGRVVPTWNYVAVHASGPLRYMEDREWLARHLERLTARHESHRERPWRIDDAPADYIERALGDIVGIELEVSRLEGKWKMSQNRSAADITGVVAGLGVSPDDRDRAVAAIVEARRPASKRLRARGRVTGTPRDAR
ncbi:MAG TPA: FMN-binding negative transcriptional regulator [Gemmatimonadaceae bacterium]|nr:FMN-binding negative transcriptional regulator [Gemmatimonadaceae bacterium]